MASATVLAFAIWEASSREDRSKSSNSLLRADMEVCISFLTILVTIMRFPLIKMTTAVMDEIRIQENATSRILVPNLLLFITDSPNSFLR